MVKVRALTFGDHPQNFSVPLSTIASSCSDATSSNLIAEFPDPVLNPFLIALIYTRRHNEAFFFRS